MEEKVRKFEKAEAEKMAKELVEADRLQAAETARIKAEEDAQEAIDKAEREKQAAELQAEEYEWAKLEAEKAERLANSRRIHAEQQAKVDAEKAAETALAREIKRQEDEKEAERVAQEIRDSDKRHIGNVRRAAKEALMIHAKLTEEQAKKVVLAIHKKAIPSITINY